MELRRRSARHALGGQLHAAASSGFFNGLPAGCLVAAGVSAAGAILTRMLLPAQPLRAGTRADEAASALPAAVPAD